MVITPVRTPLAVGVNVTAMVQLPETATGDVAEQLVLGSSAKSPEAIRELMVRVLLPVLIKVTDCAVAVVPTTVLPKIRLEGISDTPGAVPLPVRVMVCVPPLASSLMVTTPVRVPLAVGVNVTAMVHVLATATGDEDRASGTGVEERSRRLPPAQLWSGGCCRSWLTSPTVSPPSFPQRYCQKSDWTGSAKFRVQSPFR